MEPSEHSEDELGTETDPEFDGEKDHDDPDPESCLDCWGLRQLYAPGARDKLSHACTAHSDEPTPRPMPSKRSQHSKAGRKGAMARNAMTPSKKTPNPKPNTRPLGERKKAAPCIP